MATDPKATSLIHTIAVVVVATIGLGAAGTVAVVARSNRDRPQASRVEPNPIQGGTVLIYTTDADEYARDNDVSIDVAFERLALRPGLDDLATDISAAAGARLLVVEIDDGKSYGLDVGLTPGVPVERVDGIAREYPEYVSVVYAKELTNTEIDEVIDDNWETWRTRFPSLRKPVANDGRIEFLTNTPEADEIIRDYVAHHGASQIEIRFEHGFLDAE